MTLFYKHKQAEIHLGDCLDVLRGMSSNSIHAGIMDPPYALNFMGMAHDAIVPPVEIWQEILRVLRPGAPLIAFGGTRTYHRMVSNIEDAGFEIRNMIGNLYSRSDKLRQLVETLEPDQLGLLEAALGGDGMGGMIFGSGMGLAAEVSKRIDKEAGREREVIIQRKKHDIRGGNLLNDKNSYTEANITAPACPESAKWEGWHANLKPGFEPICSARKPLEKGLTLAANVLKWGCGGLNIGKSRITSSDNDYNHSGNPTQRRNGSIYGISNYDKKTLKSQTHPKGRFPSNLLMTLPDDQAEVEKLLELFPYSKGGAVRPENRIAKKTKNAYGDFNVNPNAFDKSEGSAARFYAQFQDGPPIKYTSKAGKDRGKTNSHSTVKPLSMMRYLCRLVCPPGGTILDPFFGSGTTGVAAVLEHFNVVGIEMTETEELPYCTIARQRIIEALLEVGQGGAAEGVELAGGGLSARL